MEIEKNKELETVQKPTKSKQTKVDKEKDWRTRKADGRTSKEVRFTFARFFN